MAQVFWDLHSLSEMDRDDKKSSLGDCKIHVLLDEHLAQAQILYTEFQSGDYDSHFWLAMGHISVIEFVLYLDGEDDTAEVFRQERLNSIKEDAYVFDWAKLKKALRDSNYDCPEYTSQELMAMCDGNIKEAISESWIQPPNGLTKLARDLLHSPEPDFVGAIEAATEVALAENRPVKKKSRKGSKPSKGRDADLP